MALRILINGANGRMGQETVAMVKAEPAFEWVASCDAQDDLRQQIIDKQAQIVIDFTHALSAYENTRIILASGAHPVVGTTGFTDAQIQTLQTEAAALKRGGIIAPNFSLGAVLMMKYASQIAKYLPEVEIIELHHDNKLDSPSGTALKTAQMISQNRATPTPRAPEKAIIPHARGADYEGIAIHSVRLPGLVAHQTVLFGGHHETLSLRHDSVHRAAFMPGVKLACQKVMGLKHLVYGLENLLD